MKVTPWNQNRNLSRETRLKMDVGELGASLRGRSDTFQSLVASEVDVISSDPKILMGASTLRGTRHAALASLSGAACAGIGAAATLLGSTWGTAGSFWAGMGAVALVSTLAGAVEKKLSPYQELDLQAKPILLTGLGCMLAPASMAGAVLGGAVAIHALDLLQKVSLSVETGVGLPSLFH